MLLSRMTEDSSSSSSLGAAAGDSLSAGGERQAAGIPNNTIIISLGNGAKPKVTVQLVHF